MRLSDAIALGLPEITFDWTKWLYVSDGSCKGCLAGAALYANGRRTDVHDLLEIRALAEHWPWVNGWRWKEPMPCCGEHLNFGDNIGNFLTHLAKHYAEKKITAEQVLDIVRSVEPTEPEWRAEQELERMVESDRDWSANTR